MTEASRSLPFGSGNNDEFQHLTDPYRHELLVHCYRLLGSLEDAEDAVQETLLRAWRRLASLQTQSSLRAWLYKIATNVSLDMLDRHKTRSMPVLSHAPADPYAPLAAPITDPVWLDPLPDIYLDGYIVNPEARYEAHESVTLAFLAALQKLPGRQRAILILRDVLGWKAEEVADLLEITVASVNSALQRARATLKKWQPEKTSPAQKKPDSIQTTALLTRYVEAWETADITSLLALLREDAALTMPPLSAWYRGHAAIGTFLDRYIFRGQPERHFHLKAIRANGCPAFAVYERDQTGVYRLVGLQVLTIVNDQITQIDDFLFLGKHVISHFSLPLTDES